MCILQAKPTMVELVPGYGVNISRRQIDEVESCCDKSPTKLMRKLMSVFFNEEVLAQSSCYGSRDNKKLDEDIVAACISKQNITKYASKY